MRSKTKQTFQLNFLAPTLEEQLNPKHELYLLSKEIDWDYFEQEFAVFSSDKGRPAKEIRLMVGFWRGWCGKDLTTFHKQAWQRWKRF